jgi:hypothetical protein
MNHDDDHLAANAAPTLTDEAVMYIHRALENYLHLFEQRYGDQMRRYYQARERGNVVPSQPRVASKDDEPF